MSLPELMELLAEIGLTGFYQMNVVVVIQPNLSTLLAIENKMFKLHSY